VISQGLKPEEWVVIEGIQKLKPGIKVNPERVGVLKP
jgi:multidrug efflux system membrane fusion protein